MIGDNMDEYINIIIDKHKTLFGDNPVVNKINVGFTNTIYNINDLYIIKICSDTSNEDKFIKEIDFYPEIINTPYLEKRLSIYTMLYELDHLVRFYPKYYDELKSAVFNAVKSILE